MKFPNYWSTLKPNSLSMIQEEEPRETQPCFSDTHRSPTHGADPKLLSRAPYFAYVLLAQKAGKSRNTSVHPILLAPALVMKLTQSPRFQT